jgi:hypothetical protein
VTTVERATEIALAMPGAEQKGHFGNVDFRMRNKVFASFPSQDTLTLRLDSEHAHLLVESDSEAYALHPGVWGQRGWIRVALSQIAPDDLADLMHDSWSRVAPKRLVDSNSS